MLPSVMLRSKQIASSSLLAMTVACMIIKAHSSLLPVFPAMNAFVLRDSHHFTQSCGEEKSIAGNKVRQEDVHYGASLRG